MAVEARGANQLHHLVRLVLVGALRPDRLAGLERDRDSGATDLRALVAKGNQVHLDAPLARVPDRLVLERGQIEVRAELPDHPHQDVLVERGSDAERVVVSEQELVDRLDQVRAQEERISRTHGLPDLGEEIVRGRRIEVADVRSEKEDQQPAVRRPLTRRVPQTFLVGRAVPHDRDVLERSQRPLRELESRQGDVDQMEQSPLRPGDAVPRQPADRLEERRPERVVEIPRLDLLR